MSKFATYRFNARYSLLMIPACLIMLSLMPSGGGVSAGGDEQVGVEGSNTKYRVDIENKIEDKDVKLKITGVAQRKKSIFKVYTIGSYIQQGIVVHTAAELTQRDCAKQLHLVMERDVDGKTMAEAFIEGIDLNYPKSNFSDHKKVLLEFMKPLSLKTGDQIWLTHVPGGGFKCKLPGDKELLIKDLPFSVAIWEIYLGDKNISEAVKAGLISRLPKNEKK